MIGNLRKGVALPNPRFTNNNNGTITDNLTGLTWLTYANYLGPQTWANELTAANALAFQQSPIAPNAERTTQAGRSYLLPAFAHKAESHVQ